MQKIKVVFTNERLSSNSGLSIVGSMLNASGLSDAVNAATVTSKRSQPYIKNGDILHTYISLLTLGQTEFSAVEEFQDDPSFYRQAMQLQGNTIPSAETIRQRMDNIGSSQRDTILQANSDMLVAYGINPERNEFGMVNLDLDVTPFDNSKTSKEGVSRTYKGFDGYAPMMAYLGSYLVNAELREGKQHCQKHTPEFLQETLKYCHKITDAPLFVRMDSGNDALQNLGILMDDGCWFNVKRNLRGHESKESWLDLAKEHCKNIRTPRDGKTVYVGSSWKDVTYLLPDGTKVSKCLRIVYEVIERTIDKKGQYLLPSDIEVNTFWTNTSLTDDQIIEQYHKHGECEQYHSEIKTDMDVERLPSGKFETNELVLELTVLAYNILRVIGQEAIKSGKTPNRKRNVKRLRLRTVISKIMYMAGHITRHAHQTILSIGVTNVWRHVFAVVNQQLTAG